MHAHAAEGAAAAVAAAVLLALPGRSNLYCSTDRPYWPAAPVATAAAPPPPVAAVGAAAAAMLFSDLLCSIL